MASEHEAGTQVSDLTAGGVEHTLNTTTPMVAAGTYQLVVDVAAMLSGDTLEIRVKEKVRSSTTQRLVTMDTLGGVQAEPAWVSPALILIHGFDFTLKQTAGSSRSSPWSIRVV